VGAASGRLSGRVSIVTGAGHGIGSFYARRLAREGAAVVLSDLDVAAAETIAAELRTEGHQALAVHADVRSRTSLDEMTAATLEAFGKVDILVNNAGVMAVIPMSRVGFEEVSEEEWDLVLNINLKGTWLACQAVVPAMRAAGYGKIINIGSSTALKGSPGRIHYVASKGGIGAFTRTLARELGGTGIRVNCIIPGSTLSEEAPDDSAMNLRNAAVGQRAIPRVQRPADLEGPLLFFASEDSDFISGQSLVVDGGSFLQ